MGALDTLVVSTALNTIREDLHASVEELEWTVNAYNLTFAVLLITAAALGDRYGRRALYAAGLALFAVASAGCALAPGVGWLIAARAVQGAGAALILPLGLALLSAAFPPERRGAAIGIFSAITGLAVASGPLVGGAIVEGLAWQWIFWLNVPVGLLAVPLVLSRMRESRGLDGRDTAIDVRGLVLVSGGALGVVWALVRGNQSGWASAEVVGALGFGAVLSIAFVDWQRRAPAPMLPLGFFRSRAFAAGNAAIFFTFASLFSAVFFYAQMLQAVSGYGPLGAGLRLIPWTATFLTVAPVAGALADKIGERWLLTVGLVLEAVGMLWLASVASTDLSYAAMLGPFVVAGVGVSMAIPCAQNAVVGSVGMDALGKAAGVNTMMRELGGVFGIAITVAVFAGTGSYYSPASFVDGFGPAIGVAAGLAFAGALCGFVVPSRVKSTAPVPALAGEDLPVVEAVR
jgi:EmrB/QacA subfamily drug resistance transporter